MTTSMDIERKLIEDSLPLKILGEYAQREKPAISKTLSGLHLWWARRPLTMSRAIIAACLLPAPQTSRERREYHQLLKEACALDAGHPHSKKSGTKMKFFSIDKSLQKLISRIKQNNKGEKVTLLDPFAGGGSIPFEALRLGLDVIANDLNPVSYLIREAGLRYIPETNLSEVIHPIEKKKTSFQITILAKKVEEWSEKIIQIAYRELKEIFEDDTLLYVWSKTCHCKTCGSKIPLHSFQYILKTPNRNFGIVLKIDEIKKTFRFIVKEIDKNNQPSPKIRDRRGVTCPFCKTRTTTLDDVKEEGKLKGLEYHPICKICSDNDGNRTFSPMTEEDLSREKRARELLKENIKKSKRFTFIPNEPAPPKEALGSRAALYGYNTFDKFFSPRQALFLGTVAQKIRESYPKILEDVKNEKMAKTILLCLSFTLNRIANYNSQFTVMHPSRGGIAHTFATPSLRMSWDYVESNPFTPGSGSWSSALNMTIKSIKSATIIKAGDFQNIISTSTNLPLEDKTIDLVITDPPYYDYIGYADLSDFFYVWMKRTLGEVFNEAFKSPLTPKKGELILSKKEGQTKEALEKGLLDAWKEVSRVLKPNGILVVMFTHKSTEAWEQLFQTLHNAGFYTTATWPILSELPTKMLQDRANVNTTLNIVCRKRSIFNQSTGTFKTVKVELTQKIRQKCIDFWNLDMYGSDFFVAAIGPAMEVYAKYDSVIRTSGEKVSLGELIDFTREIVANIVLEKLLAETAAALDHRSRVYVLWRWAYLKAVTSADDLLTFLKGVGGEREELESEKRIKIDKSKVSYLGPFERKNSLKWKSSENWELNLPLIDHLHISCILREEGAYEDYQKYLKFINAQNQLNHPFWKLTRSLFEILQPLQSSGKNSGKGRSKELEAYRKVLENIPSVDIKREKEKQPIKLNGFLSKGED